MEITGSSPERIDIELAFLKPMRNTQQVEFVLTPDQRAAPTSPGGWPASTRG